jgi:hypothetical protein
MKTSVCYCYIGNLKYPVWNLAFNWIILTDFIGYTWFFPPTKNSWISYLYLSKAGECVTRRETFISWKRRQDVRRNIGTSVRNHAFRGCLHSYPRDSWSIRPCIVEDFWLLGYHAALFGLVKMEAACFCDMLGSFLQDCTVPWNCNFTVATIRNSGIVLFIDPPCKENIILQLLNIHILYCVLTFVR